MNTGELDILRLAVAVGVNVYAARYVARLARVDPDVGGALAIGAMLYTSSRPIQEKADRTLLDKAARALTAPGAMVVNALAQSTAKIGAPE